MPTAQSDYTEASRRTEWFVSAMVAADTCVPSRVSKAFWNRSTGQLSSVVMEYRDHNLMHRMADFQLAKKDYPKWLDDPQGQIALENARTVSGVPMFQEEELTNAGEWTLVTTNHDIRLIWIQLSTVSAATMMLPRSQRRRSARV